MQELSIEEIKGLDAGFVVPAVRGKLTQVWDYKQGEHEEYGAWQIQSTALKIGSETIRATFFNYPDLKKDRNKEFLITSSKGKKGFHGVYAIDNEYKGKTTRELKITDAAQMKPANEDSAEQPEEAQSTPAPAAEKHPPIGEGKYVVRAGNSLEKAKMVLAQVNNALYLVTKSVAEVTDVLQNEGIEVTTENFGGMCAQAMRLLDIDSLPVEPVWEKPSEPAMDEDEEPLPRPETATDDDSEIPF